MENRSVAKSAVLGWGLLFLLLAFASTAFASERKTYKCSNSNDFFTNTCIVDVEGVTRSFEQGELAKGHLVSCQSRAYTCIKGVCSENFRGGEISFSIPMNDYVGFCSLLCNKPACSGAWVPK